MRWCCRFSASIHAFAAGERMARFLRALADELDQPYPSHRNNTAQPLGTGLRWNGHDLLIGRALWDGIGRPRTVAFEFSGAMTRIRAAPGGDYTARGGFGRRGVAKIGCIRAWRIGQWAEGWRRGHIEGRAIVFESDATRDALSRRRHRSQHYTALLGLDV